VAGDQPGVRLGGQAREHVVGQVHAGQVGEDGEGAVAFGLLVEVQGVGGEHHGAVLRGDGHYQLAGRVAADLGCLDARSYLVLIRDEREPALAACRFQIGELVRLGVRGELGAAGERAGPEVVFGPADDDLRGRELMEVPDVIPVRVGHDDGAHVRGVDAERRQRVRGGGGPGAAPPVADRRGEAGVDEHDGAAAVADDPEVIVEVELRVRLAVQVIVEEGLGARGDPVAEADRQHLARAVASHVTAIPRLARSRRQAPARFRAT
jgi:hypothetical protein